MTKVELIERLADARDDLRSLRVNYDSLKAMARNYETECVRLTKENVALRKGLSLPVPFERCPACGRANE